MMSYSEQYGTIWPYLSFKCFSDLNLIVTLYANSERTPLVGHYKYDTFVYVPMLKSISLGELMDLSLNDDDIIGS